MKSLNGTNVCCTSVAWGWRNLQIVNAAAIFLVKESGAISNNIRVIYHSFKLNRKRMFFCEMIVVHLCHYTWNELVYYEMCFGGSNKLKLLKIKKIE